MSPFRTKIFANETSNDILSQDNILAIKNNIWIKDKLKRQTEESRWYRI